jgi:hypothetical protein
MRFYIPNYDFYWTDREDGHKGGTAIAVKKDIPHTCIAVPPLLSVEATWVCIPIRNTKYFLQLFINLRNSRGVTQTSHNY